MSRAFVVAVIAALALPVLALAALIGEQELLVADAKILNVPVRGVDPRDLLRGRYIVAQLDWDWESEPTAPTRYAPLNGALCVLAGDAAKPRVRFLERWKEDEKIDGDCRLVIAGRGWSKQIGGSARFAPDKLDAGEGLVHLFVPENRAPALERLLRERPGALTVDLAVRSDHIAIIKALRIDGQVLGR